MTTGNQMFRRLDNLMRNASSKDYLVENYARDGYDSVAESTQPMNSQYEFSQVNSQDLFTQQYSSGSQSEVSNAGCPTRRPSMYDKWMNKGSISKSTIPPGELKMSGVTKSISSKQELTNPIHQISINKAKAKERDERDLLQQVATVVQDCTKEIKSTMTSMKDRIQQTSDFSTEKLQETITSFIGDLCEHQDKILNAVREKENKMIKISQLEKEISVRDTRIEELEKQIEEKKGKEKEEILKALKKEIKEPTSSIDNKIAQLLEIVSEGASLSNQQIQECKHQTELQRKYSNESHQKHQSNIKSTEYRILEELNTIKDELKYNEGAWQKQCLDQLYKVQENQFRSLQKQLVNIIGNPSKNSCQTQNQIGIQNNEIEYMFKQQWENVELFLETQFNRHFEEQEQQLQKLLERISRDHERSLVKLNKENYSQLNLPHFEDQFDRYHSDVKKQIVNLHECHREEIKRIQEELREQRLMREGSLNSNQKMISNSNHGQNSSLTATGTPGKINSSMSAFDRARLINPRPNSFPRPNNLSLPPTRHSPLSAYGPLSSKFLFAKPQPSPVAAVLPQKKITSSKLSEVEHQKDSQENHSLDEEEVYEDFAESEEDAVDEGCKKKSKKSKKGKKRKRRRIFTKKKSASKSKIVEDKQKDNAKKPKIEPNKGEQLENSIGKRILRSSTAKNKPTEAAQSKEEKNTSKNLTPLKSPDLISHSSAKNSSHELLAVNNDYDYQSKKSVYEFDDEQPQSLCNIKPSQTTFTYERKIQQFHNQVNPKIQENKSFSRFQSPPPASIITNGSRDSSPSMSLTEVVIKRKIKCDKRTPDLRNFNRAQTYNFGTCEVSCPRKPVRDMLATSPATDPIFSQTDPLQNTLTQNHVETMNMDPPHNYPIYDQRNEKNFVEITESVRRQTQRRYFQVDGKPSI